jgi:hypothetical protein
LLTAVQPPKGIFPAVERQKGEFVVAWHADSFCGLLGERRMRGTEPLVRRRGVVNWLQLHISRNWRWRWWELDLCNGHRLHWRPGDRGGVDDDGRRRRRGWHRARSS